MKVIGPDFPKCPICRMDMVSITVDEVPLKTAQEMARYNRYQPLNPNYWYECKEHQLVIHKLAVYGK